jgi:type I restriction enzyme R subunit
VLGEAIAKALASHHAMSEQTLQNPKVFEDLAEALLTDVYEQARAAAANPV